MKASQLSPFLWELSDVDLGHPNDDVIREIKRLLYQDGAVLLRDQDLDDAQQIAFARELGVLSGHNPEDRAGFDRADAAPLQRLTNEEGVGRFSELNWHSDNQFTAFPIRYLMLYALDVTTDGVPLVGGETKLASSHQAIERLPAGLREELGHLRCRIDARERGHFDRPCIENHWASGKPYLLISQMTSEVLDVSAERSAEIISAVQDVIYDPAFAYCHQWREGDLLVWDNHLLQHGRMFFDNAQTRVLRRTAVGDEMEPTALTV